MRWARWRANTTTTSPAYNTGYIRRTGAPSANPLPWRPISSTFHCSFSNVYRFFISKHSLYYFFFFLLLCLLRTKGITCLNIQNSVDIGFLQFHNCLRTRNRKQLFWKWDFSVIALLLKLLFNSCPLSVFSLLLISFPRVASVKYSLFFFFFRKPKGPDESQPLSQNYEIHKEDMAIHCSKG